MLEEIEEKFVLGQLTAELYHKYDSKYRADLALLEQEMRTASYDGSNLEKVVNKMVSIAANLSFYWASANFESKRQLQHFMFTSSSDRTQSVNGLFDQIPLVVGVWKKTKKAIQK